MDQSSTIFAFAGLGVSIAGAVLMVWAPGRGNRGYRNQATLAYLIGVVLVLIGLVVMCVRDEIYNHFFR